VGSHLTRLTPVRPNTPTETTGSKGHRKLLKTVVADKPLDAVFGYLSDFTTTTDWDPGTVTTVRRHGNGAVGTTYLNTSTFLGRTTQLTFKGLSRIAAPLLKPAFERLGNEAEVGMRKALNQL
jgi:hypothetical protein